MRVRRGPPTLATVAASAGVSVATVSKVLNGRADVGPETRARVQDLLEQHEYVERRAELAPAAARVPTVELVFHGALSTYTLEILQGVMEPGTEAGVGRGQRPARARQGRGGRVPAWVRQLTSGGPPRSSTWPTICAG